MWYLIGLVGIVLIGSLLYAISRNNKEGIKKADEAKETDKPLFRTEESLSTYKKPMDADRPKVDFDDAD